jgi:hypothetical protein
MNTKNYILIAVGITFWIGLNVFLAQRDSKQIESYDPIKELQSRPSSEIQ